MEFLIGLSINTGKTGDVERSPCATPMLVVQGKTDELIHEISSPKRSTFFLGT